MAYPGFKFMKIDVGFEVDSLGSSSELPQRDELSHTWNMILRDIQWDPQVHLKNITMIEGQFPEPIFMVLFGLKTLYYTVDMPLFLTPLF